LKERFLASGWAGQPIECVYNGYMEAPPEILPAEDHANRRTLRICFTGKLYEHPSYTIAPFFEAIARIRETRPSVFRALEIDFYGILNSDFAVQLDRFGLREIVRFHGMVSRQDAVRAQATADALFFLVPDSPEYEVVVCSKTFEYMATRKPLLAIIPKAGEN